MPNYPASAPITPRHRSDDLVDSASLARCTGHYYPGEEVEMRAMGITLPVCPRHEDSEYVGRHADTPRHRSDKGALVKYLFTTTDSRLAHRSGELVEIGQPLREETYDRAEVGPMVYVWFADGEWAEVFVGELQQTEDSEYVGRHADTFLPYAVEVSSLDY